MRQAVKRRIKWEKNVVVTIKILFMNKKWIKLKK